MAPFASDHLPVNFEIVVPPMLTDPLKLPSFANAYSAVWLWFVARQRPISFALAGLPGVAQEAASRRRSASAVFSGEAKLAGCGCQGIRAMRSRACSGSKRKSRLQEPAFRTIEND